MKSVLIKTTLAKLSQLESELSEIISKLNSAALAEFPGDKFISLDKDGIEVQQTQLFIINTLDVKRVELGVSIVDRQIEYYEKRFNQMDRYYGFEQLPGLYEAMQHLLSDIATSRAERIAKMHTAFNIELPENVNFCLRRYNLI